MTSATRLAALYAKVPKMMCRGLCTEACGIVPVHRAELVELRRVTGRRVRVNEKFDTGAAAFNHPKIRIIRPGTDLHCSLLKNGRCVAYEARPLICRLYGAAAGLLCPFGCAAERVLTIDEVKALMDEYFEISG